MYIKQESKGIINLICYPRTDILEGKDKKTYNLVIFSSYDIDSESKNECYYKHGIVIKSFEKQVDAYYCLWHLWQSIDSGKKTWNPNDVPTPTSEWRQCLKDYDKKRQPPNHDYLSIEFTQSTALKCEGTNKIIITHEKRIDVSHKIKKELDELKSKLKSRLALSSTHAPIIEWKLKE